MHIVFICHESPSTEAHYCMSPLCLEPFKILSLLVYDASLELRISMQCQQYDTLKLHMK